MKKGDVWNNTNVSGNRDQEMSVRKMVWMRLSQIAAIVQYRIKQCNSSETSFFILFNYVHGVFLDLF